MFGLLAFFFFLFTVIPLLNNRTDGVFITMLFALLCAILAAIEPEPRKSKIRYRDGFVYVVKSLTNNAYYKIGRTRNLHRRTKTFDVKLPFDVEIVCLIKTEDMYKLEGELHGRYVHKRKDGEWFNLSHEDLLWLKSFPGNQIEGSL